MELLRRLAALIPPPRVHLVRYFGVLAPNAALREQVIQTAGPSPALLDRLKHAAERMGIHDQAAEDDTPEPPDEPESPQPKEKPRRTSVVCLDQCRNDRDRRSAALQTTSACANMPYWNSEIVSVSGERAFEIPTSEKYANIVLAPVFLCRLFFHASSNR